MDISKQQSSDWQRLADVPEPEFERAITQIGHQACYRSWHYSGNKAADGKA